MRAPHSIPHFFLALLPQILLPFSPSLFPPLLPHCISFFLSPISYFFSSISFPSLALLPSLSFPFAMEFLFLFLRIVLFGFTPGSLGCLVSRSRSPKQCQVWVSSHTVGLKSDQILVGYSRKVYATIAPALLTGVADYRWRFCGWVGTNISLLVVCRLPSCCFHSCRNVYYIS